MWHVSISGFGLSVETLRTKALRVLEGVGDADLGQWEELGPKALHVRRRLTGKEAAQVGGVCDVRGTPEAQKRFDAMAAHLPLGWTEIL